jgi:hypothetical protein
MLQSDGVAYTSRLFLCVLPFVHSSLIEVYVHVPYSSPTMLQTTSEVRPLHDELLDEDWPIEAAVSLPPEIGFCSWGAALQPISVRVDACHLSFLTIAHGTWQLAACAVLL